MIPGEPRRHARDTRPLPAPAKAAPTDALTLTDEARDYITGSVEHLEEGAAQDELDARQLRERATELEACAATKRHIAREQRRILDLAEVAALHAEQARLEREATAYGHAPEPTYDQLPIPPDVPEFAKTWGATPDPWEAHRRECGCDPWRGESCEQCDILIPQHTSLWRSNDGRTAPLPAPPYAPSLANGEQP